MNQARILQKIAEIAHDQILKEREKPNMKTLGPIQLALILADHPVCDLQRLEMGQALIPHLRKGENIDTGALRILANAIKSNLSEFYYCRSSPSESANPQKFDTRPQLDSPQKG